MKSFTVFLLFRGINFFKSTLRASPQGVADFSGFPLRINSNFPSFLFPFCLDVCSINFSDADILFAIIPNWKGIWKIRIFDNTSLAWTLIEFEIFGILEMEDCIEVWVHAARKDFFFFLLLFNILYRGGRTKRIERSEFVFSVKIYNVEKKVHKFSKDNQGYYESGYNAIKQI